MLKEKIRSAQLTIILSACAVSVALSCRRSPAGEADCGPPPSALSMPSESAVARNLNVFAREGLILREAPSREAKKLALIPFGTTVCVTRTNEPQKKITVRGIPGEFVATTYQGLRGYIFDGFLSKLPAPDSPDYSLGEYLRKAFGPITATEWLRTDFMRDSAVGREVAHYKKGIQVIHTYSLGGYTTHIIFPDKYEVREIYLLLFPGGKMEATLGYKYPSPDYDAKKPDHFEMDWQSGRGLSEYVAIEKKSNRVHVLQGFST